MDWKRLDREIASWFALCLGGAAIFALLIGIFVGVPLFVAVIMTPMFLWSIWGDIQERLMHRQDSNSAFEKR